MKIDYLFSRNKKWGSRLISWAASYEKLGLDKNPSHMAVLMNDTWVLESTLNSGIRVVPYFKWKEINEELYKIPCAQMHRHSTEILEKALIIWGKKYDWIGVMFFCWSYVKLIVKNEPLPTTNKWQNKDKYFCTEYVGHLLNEDLSMKSPARICAEWLKDLEK
jgi:hypothetical protein